MLAKAIRKTTNKRATPRSRDLDIAVRVRGPSKVRNQGRLLCRKDLRSIIAISGIPFELSSKNPHIKGHATLFTGYMNAPTLFGFFAPAPEDPVFKITAQFRNDVVHPKKVNLGVGVYQDADGRTEDLAVCIKAAQQLAGRARPTSYLPMSGNLEYLERVATLVFGESNAALREGRIASFQTLGGTNALSLGGHLLKVYENSHAPHCFQKSKILVSEQTWENHIGVMRAAGLPHASYRYYHEAQQRLDFTGMMEDLNRAVSEAPADGTPIVLLHVSCHNPTGMDLSKAQWDELAAFFKTQRALPFLDFAYQGFAEDVDADAYPVRTFTEAGIEFVLAYSCSKNFGQYNRRIGALSVVTRDKQTAAMVKANAERFVIRPHISNPPTDGAAIVAEILGDAALTAAWKAEVGAMRERIYAMRTQLVEKLHTRGVNRDFSFLLTQRGMFSYSGLSVTQITRLRDEFGIYALESGRICLAALTEQNIDYVVESIAMVLTSAPA